MINLFPIQPTFVTRIKEYKSDDPDGLNDFDLNNHGILGIDDTQGFLAVIAHGKFVNAPVTLYEFIPQNLRYYPDLIKMEKDNQIRIPEINKEDIFKRWLGDRFIVRTDNINHFNLKKCCAKFRSFVQKDDDINGIRFCEKYDLRVTLFALKDLSEDNLEVALNSIITEFNEDKQDDKIIFVEKEEGYRSFIYYQCPISGFYEAIFPIFHERKVIGCVWIGEIIHEELTVENVTKKFKSFFENIPDLEYDFKKIEKSVDLDFSKFRTNLQTSVKEYYRAKVLLDKDYYFRDSVEYYLRNIESKVRQRVGLLRQRYVSTRFSIIKDAFEREVFIQNSENELNIFVLSKIIEKALEKIISYFPNENGFIRIFISDINGNEKVLKIIAASDRKELKQNIWTEDYTYDLTLIHPDIIDKNRNVSTDISDIDNEFSYNTLQTLNNGIRYKGSNLPIKHFYGKNIIRYYPTLAKNVYFIIWERYSDNFRENYNQFQLFKEAIFDFYRTIAANYAALWGSIVEKRLIDSARIAAHEANQIIPSIISSFEFNFSDPIRTSEIIRNNTHYKKVEDIKNQLELLRLVQVNYSLLFKNIKIGEKKEIDIVNLFRKLRNLYGKQMNLLKKEFIVEVLTPYRIIQGNPILVEHSINNLVDNAIKHSSTGTRIICRLEEKNQKIRIEVISIGQEILEKDKIYALYSRGSNIQKDGNGIGLFICKQIINSHGWTINHSSQPVLPHCGLDIACIAWYNSLQNKNGYDLSDEQKKEIACIVSSEYIKYVSQEANGEIRYKPDPYTFKAICQKKSFVNSFFINIPKP